MGNEVKWLFFIAALAATVFILWWLITVGNSTGAFEKPQASDATIESVAPISKPKDAAMDAEYDEYIAKVKAKLHHGNILSMEDYLSRVDEANKNNPMTADERKKLEASIVRAEMKEQIKERFDQEIPTPTKSYGSTASDEDFFMNILDYYEENRNKMIDGGVALRQAMADAIKDETVDLLDIIHIQDVYSQYSIAATKDANNKVTSEGVYSKMLAYYEEVDQMKESADTLALKAAIKEVVSDDFVSAAELSKINALYIDIKDKVARAKLKDMNQ